MKSQIFDQFMHDPDYLRLKTEMMSLFSAYQAKLVGIQGPQEDLSVSYQSLIRSFSTQRGGDLFYNYLGSGLGKGALVQLADGSVKYDFISGIGSFWGHGMPELVSASLDAAFSDTVIQGNLQQTNRSAVLTEQLCRLSGFSHCFLTSSGAMADENALKLAFHYGKTKTRLLAFERCFMGRTLALAQVTDNVAYRSGLPATLSVDYVPFYDYKDPEGSLLRAEKALKTYMARYPNQHAVMCFELVQGEGGYYAGTEVFFKRLMTLLKEAGIPILVDEIQTFGRGETLFAFQHFGLEDFVDIVTVGKLMHVCATLFRPGFLPQPGLISQTFTSSSSAIESAIAILDAFEHRGFLGETGRNKKMAACISEQLTRLSEAYPSVIKGPFGFGLMVGFQVGDGSKETTMSFVKRLFDKGVIGFTAGRDPMRVRFLPPVGAVSTDDIVSVFAIIEALIKEHYA